MLKLCRASKELFSLQVYFPHHAHVAGGQMPADVVKKHLMPMTNLIRLELSGPGLGMKNINPLFNAIKHKLQLPQLKVAGTVHLLHRAESSQLCQQPERHSTCLYYCCPANTM